MKAATMLQTSTQETIRPTTASAEDRTGRIRELNDAFRKNPFVGRGRFMLTQGIVGLSDDERREVIELVLGFTAFTEANDPHTEHDFGAMDFKGQKIFWKIDYYTPDLKHGSPDPADPAVTCRVLTVMLASEY